MNRQQKEQFVDSLQQRLQGAQGAFLVKYQGLSVAQMQNLRGSLSEKGAALQVAKNRLTKIAIKKAVDYQGLEQYLTDQLAIVFANQDLTGTAKALKDFAKTHEALQLIAGASDAQTYDAKQVQALASIPSREVLLAQLCGVLNGPLTGYVMVLRQILVKFLLTLKAVQEQKS